MGMKISDKIAMYFELGFVISDVEQRKHNSILKRVLTRRKKYIKYHAKRISKRLKEE